MGSKRLNIQQLSSKLHIINEVESEKKLYMLINIIQLITVLNMCNNQ